MSSAPVVLYSCNAHQDQDKVVHFVSILKQIAPPLAALDKIRGIGPR